MVTQEKLTQSTATKTLGAHGASIRNGTIRGEDFIPKLRGNKAIKKYAEMRENDATIGAVMYAVEQILRDVKLKVKPKDDSDAAKVEAEYVESVLEDMDHTLDDHVSEAISFLSYGFSWFEVVYKRREGPLTRNPKKRSKYSDGRFGVKKLVVRAPWTINRFDMGSNGSSPDELCGVYQNTGTILGRGHYIPLNKSLHYKTTALNGDPAGRPVLRNAYTSYEILQMVQMREAIGIERDLVGIPIIEVPAEYLSPDATESQVAVRQSLEEIGRDLKQNEQSFVILPSDVYNDADGKPSSVKMVNIRLMGTDSGRSIDTGPIITRYQHDIARSVLSEFIMLGAGPSGSYALSKSKTDLFLRALESYIQSIVDVLNKQLVERLWELNGLDYSLMPKIEAGDVAPHDLRELGAYLRNLNGADISLADQTHIVDALLENAELPSLDKEVYSESRNRALEADKARNGFYDKGNNKEEETEVD